MKIPLNYLTLQKHHFFHHRFNYVYKSTDEISIQISIDYLMCYIHYLFNIFRGQLYKMHLISSIDMHIIVSNRLRQKIIVELPRIPLRWTHQVAKNDSILALLHQNDVCICRDWGNLNFIKYPAYVIKNLQKYSVKLYGVNISCLCMAMGVEK